MADASERGRRPRRLDFGAGCDTMKMKVVFNEATMTLDELSNGQAATIGAVGGEGPFRRRLLELGLVPGTAVERVGQAPLGDPLTYRVRRAVVCLRRTEAALIGLVGGPVAEAK